MTITARKEEFTKEKVQERTAYIRGFAAACADVCRLHDPEIAFDAIQGAGLTIQDFKFAGVEDYDLDELRRAI